MTTNGSDPEPASEAEEKAGPVDAVVAVVVYLDRDGRVQVAGDPAVGVTVDREADMGDVAMLVTVAHQWASAQSVADILRAEALADAQAQMAAILHGGGSRP